jgi:tetrahydromethanopterin:alpha-L-glutamate ligase
MNIGVIGIHGAWSTESLSQQLKKKGAGGAVLELAEISYDLAEQRYFHHRHNLDDFDGFILKKLGRQYSASLLDELELLELLERSGFKFFSSPKMIRKMISRLSCTIQLRDNDIPMPATFITQDRQEALEWAVANAPVILKPLYSTKARGMAMLTDEASAQEGIKQLLASGERIIYLQKKLDLSGSDYGLVFLGGDYIGAYARVSDGSTWHTTTREGGTYGAYTPPQAFIDLAQKAQDPFKLDFTCVDIADTREMGPIVFEVSAFGGYKGLFESSGLDASDLLTDYAISKMTN